MNIEEFIENFADQLDDTPASDLTPDTLFRELDEWTSLTALSIIAMVDEEYGVSISSQEFKSAKTIKDLYDNICKGL